MTCEPHPSCHRCYAGIKEFLRTDLPTAPKSMNIRREEKRHRLLDGNLRKHCNVTGNNHSIPAREFNATRSERTLRKSYLWSLGQFSFPSADPEGRFPAYKEIHERGIGRFHEFFPVLWITTQFRTDGSPYGVQPCLQNCFAQTSFTLLYSYCRVGQCYTRTVGWVNVILVQ